MVSMVVDAKDVLMVRWMRPSVSGSTLAVASSSISTRLLRRMARARQNSCFWPCRSQGQHMHMSSRCAVLKPIKTPPLPRLWCWNKHGLGAAVIHSIHQWA